MASPRRKADSQDAPQTIEEAVADAAVYLDTLAQIEAEKLAADRDIDARRALRDDVVATLEKRAKDLFLGLRSWWSVEKQELTDGKRKSIELAGAEIGERKTPPRLTHAGLKSADMVNRLRSARKRQFLTIKFSLNKPTLIAAIRAGGTPSKLLEKMGFATAQREEFFIDRVEPEAADPKTIETPDTEVREAAQ